jgi:chemotaxis regulatin CheY-phosphate phosphatase CheZ
MESTDSETEQNQQAFKKMVNDAAQFVHGLLIDGNTDVYLPISSFRRALQEALKERGLDMEYTHADGVLHVQDPKRKRSTAAAVRKTSPAVQNSLCLLEDCDCNCNCDCEE